ncbi:hypothetical protein MMC28_003831 [Mycoblastus sanguinarius]|nr:hypothetical protein [Mycoblastus sanguinarius]
MADQLAPQTSSKKGRKRCMFTSLATETRLEIYICLFADFSKPTVHQPTLRRPEELSSRDQMFGVISKGHTHIVNNNIIFTCRKVYQEATPVFYNCQTFHYSIHVQKPYEIPRPFTTQLPLMKHLSLDLASECNQDPTILDNILCNHVTNIVDHCPMLRTLTLHIFRSPIEKAFITNSTGKVLSKLYPRLDRLSIVAFGKSNFLTKITDSIAPRSAWRSPDEAFTTWPRISLSEQQIHSAIPLYLPDTPTLQSYQAFCNTHHLHRENEKVFVSHLYRPEIATQLNLWEMPDADDWVFGKQDPTRGIRGTRHGERSEREIEAMMAEAGLR